MAESDPRSGAEDHHHPQDHRDPERATKKIRWQDSPATGNASFDPNSSHGDSLDHHHESDVPHNRASPPPPPAVDAKTFLFRSPATAAEIEEIATKIKSRIDSAYDEISAIGFEAYRNKQLKSPLDVHVHVDVHPSHGQASHDDDNMTHHRNKTLASAGLEDAVVRGNPRRYQTALVELAKKQNTIVNLGTGQGKTLIALLLIRHFAELHQAQEPPEPPRANGTSPMMMQTLFLVPSVALATQHSCTLQANLPYTVATACHNATTNATHDHSSRERMARADILVATHGAAKDLFMHYGDMFRFDRINLLIVDECHYTCGEHGYATIMKNFYHRLEKCHRPRVLGLTASPLVNIKSDVDDEKLGQMLMDLEQRLDSRLACLTKVMGMGSDHDDKDNDNGGDNDNDDDDNDGGSNSNDTKQEAEERVVHYHSTWSSSDLPTFPNHRDIGLHEGRVKEFNQFVDLYHDLGPRATSIYSATVAREISMNRYDEENKEQFEVAIQHLRYISKFCADQCHGGNGGRTEKLAVLEQLLEDIIESKGAKNTVGVVFVDRRITALALYDYFRHRGRGIADGTWIRVKDTEFNRSCSAGSGTCTATGSDHEDVTVFAPNVMRGRGKRKRLDLTNRLFEDMTGFSREELDAEVINDVLQDALPDGVDMKDLLDLEPSPMDSSCSAMDMDHGNTNKSCHEVEVDINHRTIKCDMIVRQCTSVFKYLDRSHHYSDNKDDENWLHKIQRVKDVLDGLRTKRTNVLIATSVVEEGVDVDACSFVIVFDNIRSTKGYVQMKGRARQKNARFFVFQDTSPSSSSNSYIHLKTAQLAARRVKKFIESRSEYNVPMVDPEVKFRPYTGNSIHAEEEALKSRAYRTESGMIDLSSAKPLLNRYTLSIPLHTTSRSTRDMLGMHLPQFEDNRLILPSHIPSPARCVMLPAAYMSCTKKEKRSILSLMACVRLHKLNLLNDRLLPLKRKDMQNKLLSVALTELFTAERSSLQKSPPMYSERKSVYIYKLAQYGKVFNQNDRVLGGNGRSLCFVTLVPLALDNTAMSFHHLEIDEIQVDIKNPVERKLSSDEWDWCCKFHTVLMNARWRKRTGSSFYIYNAEKLKQGILPPYVVGCLTKDGNIDWDRIKITVSEFGRTTEERIAAVRANRQDMDFEKPRIWSPIYDPYASYIAYGPSKLDCGAEFPERDHDINTYSDYFTKKRNFEVGTSTKLISVQRQWYLPRKMHKKVQNTRLFESWKQKLETKLDLCNADVHDGDSCPCDGLVAALMPFDACMEAPIADASLVLHCIALPQVLYTLDRQMTAQLFVEHCSDNLPILGAHLKSISKNSFDVVLEALTAKSCVIEDINYDKLEWLGDAVLKLIHTDALLHSKDLRKWVSYLHEGDLSVLRSAMGSNARLMQATKATGFDRFILFRQLGRSQWVPSGLELHEINEDGVETLARVEREKAGKKTNADIIESILGLIFVKVDFQAAYDVATELGITLPRDPNYDVSIGGYKPNKNIVQVACDILGGIEFKHPELLEEALTHPSCIHEEVPCYQRLEWVGDAVLCLFARTWIFKKYPDLQVGELVILEATVVCNETLAYLSVSNGLQRYLNHRDISLPGKFEEFERMCNSRGLWATDPPKCLSDILEAIFGAVFVDKGLTAATGTVEHLLRPVLDALSTALEGTITNDMTTKARGMVHPKQYVHELGGGIMTVKSWKEEILAIKKACPIWKEGGLWGEAQRNGSNHVGVIESFGIDIIGIEEKSSHIARNRACAITMEVFERHPEIIGKLKKFCTLIQRKEDKITHNQNPYESNNTDFK